MMCVCGDPILKHCVPAGEDRDSHCLEPGCGCPEFVGATNG